MSFLVFAKAAVDVERSRCWHRGLHLAAAAADTAQAEDVDAIDATAALAARDVLAATFILLVGVVVCLELDEALPRLATRL